MVSTGQIFVWGDIAWRVVDLIEAARTIGATQRIALKKLERAYRTTSSDERKGTPEFIRRALASDLRYPVLVAEGPRGGLYLLDGRHRYWKAQVSGHETISARILSFEELWEIPHTEAVKYLVSK